MATTLNYLLRFESKKQKEGIAKIAKKNNRSLNAQLLHMVDLKVLDESSIGCHDSKNKTP